MPRPPEISREQRARDREQAKQVSLRRIARLFAPHRSSLAVVIAVIVASSVVGMASPFLLRAVIDDALPHRDVRLLVVGGPSGSGLERPRSLMDLADERGVADRVNFLAPRPPSELVDVYRAADIVAVPSYSESFGLVALEAQACGTPVVAAAGDVLAGLQHDVLPRALVGAALPPAAHLVAENATTGHLATIIVNVIAATATDTQDMSEFIDI